MIFLHSMPPPSRHVRLYACDSILNDFYDVGRRIYDHLRGADCFNKADKR